jgi:hypothetical protein
VYRPIYLQFEPSKRFSSFWLGRETFRNGFFGPRSGHQFENRGRLDDLKRQDSDIPSVALHHTVNAHQIAASGSDQFGLDGRVRSLDEVIVTGLNLDVQTDILPLVAIDDIGNRLVA